MEELAKAKAIELMNKHSELVDDWDCYNDAPWPQVDIDSDAAYASLITVNEILSLLDKGPDGVFNYEVKFWSMVGVELQKFVI